MTLAGEERDGGGAGPETDEGRGPGDNPGPGSPPGDGRLTLASEGELAGPNRTIDERVAALVVARDRSKDWARQEVVDARHCAGFLMPVSGSRYFWTRVRVLSTEGWRRTRPLMAGFRPGAVSTSSAPFTDTP